MANKLSFLIIVSLCTLTLFFNACRKQDELYYRLPSENLFKQGVFLKISIDNATSLNTKISLPSNLTDTLKTIDSVIIWYYYVTDQGEQIDTKEGYRVTKKFLGGRLHYLASDTFYLNTGVQYTINKIKLITKNNIVRFTIPLSGSPAFKTNKLSTKALPDIKMQFFLSTQSTISSVNLPYFTYVTYPIFDANGVPNANTYTAPTGYDNDDFTNPRFDY